MRLDHRSKRLLLLTLARAMLLLAACGAKQETPPAPAEEPAAPIEQAPEAPAAETPVLPEDAPVFVKDYYDYYKTPRGYHKRSLNSNGGWNVTGCMSFINQPILKYTCEIRSAVLIVHGENAHSCYFSRDAYNDMIRLNKYTDNKELLILPGCVHTDLYDGGGKDAIPFDKLDSFFARYLV